MTDREYYLKNREKIIAKVSAIYYAKQEEKRAYQRQYNAEHRDAILSYSKQYYAKRKEADPSYSKDRRPPKPRRTAKPKELRPKLAPEPRKPNYEFLEASFIVSLD